MEFLSHFGLERLPLAREATSFDYYQAARHDRVLMQIQGRLAQGESRITVVGAAGMGKSILAYRLAEILSPELFAVCLLREAVVTLPGHVEAILSAVYGSTDAEQIASRKARGVQPVVIVDGAQGLHAQSEAMLDELAMAGVALVRFARGGAGDIALEPWDEGTLARMLLHRIRAAGSHRPLFDKESLLAIVRRAGGNPGVAVVLSQEALLCAWHAGAESVSRSVADALCQGDLDADALGTSVGAAAVVAVGPAVAAAPVLSPGAAPVPLQVQPPAEQPTESDDLDALLGAEDADDPSPQTPGPDRADRDFLDQSQFVGSVSADEPVDETFDLGVDELGREPDAEPTTSEPTIDTEISLELTADLSAEEPEAAGSPDVLPGSTDDFDLSQLDALVSQDELQAAGVESSADEPETSDRALDDELAAFEALASAPTASANPPAVQAPVSAVASAVASADDDLDGMFASLENEPAPAPAARVAPEVPPAPQASKTASDSPLDDIDAMLGSWESQPAAAPAAVKPSASAPKVAPAKAANIEDELDDLLAKFDS